MLFCFSQQKLIAVIGILFDCLNAELDEICLMGQFSISVLFCYPIRVQRSFSKIISVLVFLFKFKGPLPNQIFKTSAD